MRLNSPPQEKRIANAVIADPEQHTVMDADGAVRSIQAADVTMPTEELDAIWSAMHLERLARTYWRFLSRVTLGLIRVHYSATERAVVVVMRPFVLLRFHPPEYDISGDRGIVRWRIRDGILVHQQGKDRDGYLEIDVRRRPADEPGRAMVHVEVEVANFYPTLAHSIASWFYSNTQSRIHVMVTHGFLRSLARLDLEESRVGRFARFGVGKVPPPVLLDEIPQEERIAGTDGGSGSEGAPQAGHNPINVTEGTNPVPVLVAITVATGAAAYLLARRWQR